MSESDDRTGEIMVALARVEERLTSQGLMAEHRHSNLKMTIETLASKRDVEAVGERLDKVDERVEQLENNQAKVVWGVIGTFGAVVASVTGLKQKLGL